MTLFLNIMPSQFVLYESEREKNIWYLGSGILFQFESLRDRPPGKWGFKGLTADVLVDKFIPVEDLPLLLALLANATKEQPRPDGCQGYFMWAINKKLGV